MDVCWTDESYEALKGASRIYFQRLRVFRRQNDWADLWSRDLPHFASTDDDICGSYTQKPYSNKPTFSDPSCTAHSNSTQASDKLLCGKRISINKCWASSQSFRSAVRLRPKADVWIVNQKECHSWALFSIRRSVFWSVRNRKRMGCVSSILSFRRDI